MSQPRKHIVHIVHGFHTGGLEKLIVNCINQLGNAYQHTVISLTTMGDIVEQIEPDIHTICLNKPQGNSVKVHVGLFKLLHTLKPDIVQTYNIATIEYQFIAALLQVPVRIHAEHGRDSYDPSGSVKKYQYLRKLSALWIHKIVAVSEDLYTWLHQVVGIQSSKLCLIRNGINTQYFHPSQQAPSPRLFTFGHVARLQSIKNQQLLIRAYQQTCRTDPDFAMNTQLVLVGEGDERKTLEHLAQQTAFTCHIHFAGNQTNMRKQYRHFDAFVLSSLAEGIPLTLLESMSMGIPHIVTKVGGINEVIIDGNTGVGIPSDDHTALANAFLSFYHQRNTVAAMGNAARKRIETEFDEHVMVDKYRKLYESEK